MMVNLACLSGLDYKTETSSFCLSNKVVMDSPTDRESADGHTVLIDLPVREDNNAVALIYCFFSFLTNSI
jgi:hypothetical protein